VKSFAIIVLVMSVVFLLCARYEIGEAKRSMTWPARKARITEASFVKSDKGSYPRISGVFLDHNTPFTVNRYSYGEINASGYLSHFSEFRVGLVTNVYSDPGNPAIVVLSNKPSLKSMHVLQAVLLTLFAISLLFLVFRKRLAEARIPFVERWKGVLFRERAWPVSVEKTEMETVVEKDAPWTLYREIFLWQFLSGIVSAVPFAVLACICLTTWISPLRWGMDTVHYLVAVMLTEFFVMHSSPFMTAFAASDLSKIKRIILVGGIGLVYMIFAAGWSVILQTVVPVVTMILMIASRFTFVLFSGKLGEMEMKHQQMSWAVSLFAYMLLAFATSMPSSFPRLGMTEDIVASLHIPHSGLWISEPHRPVAFGFIYFSVLALFEVLFPPIAFWKARRLSR